MARIKINAATEAELLNSCRRRCAICYGLNRDFRLKQGQIAHLDHNPQNNTLSNLAFLCLDHHDQYDSRPSQSKQLTIAEVKSYRDELYGFIKKSFSVSLNIEPAIVDIYSGHYEREGGVEGAELDIKYLGNNVILVKGLALWGKKNQYGPNIGELDFEVAIHNNKATFMDRLHGTEYKLHLIFNGNHLLAEEIGISGYFGMNVTFAGEYVNIK
jgi:hypothetical protein